MRVVVAGGTGALGRRLVALLVAGRNEIVVLALAAGARRLVAQSFAGWTYARSGGPVKTESDPLDPHPLPPLRGAIDALRHHGVAVLGADGLDGVVLRYGTWYGPRTSLALDCLNLREAPRPCQGRVLPLTRRRRRLV